MPRPRYAMRKVRQILRLTLGDGVSRHQAPVALVLFLVFILRIISAVRRQATGGRRQDRPQPPYRRLSTVVCRLTTRRPGMIPAR